DGSPWGVSWPERADVVRFDARGRAETRLHFDTPIDSLAFGVAGTNLEGLLFVTHNRGAGDDPSGGPEPSHSELTIVDLATLRRVAVATGGSRGDVVKVAADGRVFVSQSHQIDVLRPVLAPAVLGTNPPAGATVV